MANWIILICLIVVVVFGISRWGRNPTSAVFSCNNAAFRRSMQWNFISDDGEIMLRNFRMVVALLLYSLPIASFAQYEACGSIERKGGGYGPDDYTNPSDFRNKLPIVDQHHFNARVESLIGGHKEETRRPTGDLGYVLFAFPNHHRALNAMVRLSSKENTSKPAGSTFTIDCWLDRAIRWRPEDAMVRMIYGNYLSSARIKRYKEEIGRASCRERVCYAV